MRYAQVEEGSFLVDVCVLFSKRMGTRPLVEIDVILGRIW